METNNKKFVFYFLVLQAFVLIISILVLSTSINIFFENLMEVKDLNFNLRNEYINFANKELTDLEKLRKLSIDPLMELKPDSKSLLLSFSLSVASGILIGFLVVSTQS